MLCVPTADFLNAKTTLWPQTFRLSHKFFQPTLLTELTDWQPAISRLPDSPNDSPLNLKKPEDRQSSHQEKVPPHQASKASKRHQEYRAPCQSHDYSLDWDLCATHYCSITQHSHYSDKHAYLNTFTDTHIYKCICLGVCIYWCIWVHRKSIAFECFLGEFVANPGRPLNPTNSSSDMASFWRHAPREQLFDSISVRFFFFFCLAYKFQLIFIKFRRSKIIKKLENLKDA